MLSKFEKRQIGKRFLSSKHVDYSGFDQANVIKAHRSLLVKIIQKSSSTLKPNQLSNAGDKEAAYRWFH